MSDSVAVMPFEEVTDVEDHKSVNDDMSKVRVSDEINIEQQHVKESNQDHGKEQVSRASTNNSLVNNEPSGNVRVSAFDEPNDQAFAPPDASFQQQRSSQQQNITDWDIPPIMNGYKWRFVWRRLCRTYLCGVLGVMPIFVLLFSCIVGRHLILYFLIPMSDEEIRDGFFYVLDFGYMFVIATLLTLLTVFSCSCARFCLYRTRKCLVRKDKKKKVVPKRQSKSKGSDKKQEQQSNDIDAQLAEILGNAPTDSDSDDDVDDTAADKKKKKKVGKRSTSRYLFFIDRLESLTGRYHGLYRDFVFRYLFSFVLYFTMLYTLTPYILKTIYLPEPAAWVLSTLVTIGLSYSATSLIASDTPELNQYASFDWWNPFYRTFYYLIAFFVITLNEAVFHYVFTRYFNIAMYAFVLFVIPPGIFFGFLPQPNVFISWGIEFMQVYFHGGTPAASNVRLFAMVVWSWLVVLCVALVYFLIGEGVAILLAFAWGFLLSQDTLVHLVQVGWNAFERLSGQKQLKPQNHYISSVQSFRWTMFRITLSFVSICIMLLSVGAGLALYFTSTPLPFSPSNSFNMDIWNYVSIGAEVLILLNFIVSELIRSASPFYFCNLVRNPISRLFSKYSVRVFRSCFQTWTSIVLSAYYILFIYRTDYFAFVQVIFWVRCFRWAWQNPRYAHMELIIAAILERALQTNYVDFPFSIKLAIFGFLTHRFHVVWNRFIMVGRMLVTPIQKPKYRFTNWQLVLLANVIFVPALIVSFVIGFLIGFPLLPLLGLPLFFLGPLRPVRTWSPTGDSYVDCEDSAFYKEMESSVVDDVSKQLMSGALMNAQPGSIVLYRSELFMIWIEILERGFCYSRVLVKGLELQTTSCHAEEATELDGVVEDLFEQKMLINRHAFHSFKPAYQSKLNSFSVSNMSLVGIMDQPDAFSNFYTELAQCMIWIINQEYDQGALSESKMEKLFKFPFDEYEYDAASSEFPSEWHRFVRGEQSTPSPPTVEDHVTGSLNTDNNSNRKSLDRWTRKFVLATVIALKKANMNEELNAFRIYELFSGESFAFDSFIRKSGTLNRIFTTAFRCAVYIQLENKMYGFGDEDTDFSELKDTLQSVTSTYSIGSQVSDHSIVASPETTTYFTLEQEKQSLGNPQYKAKYMKRDKVDFYVGTLNGEAVRSIWSNLQQELFYFTNDDDERLSIQALPTLLRNIAISAAEPPLGYPIYSSQASAVHAV